MQGLYVEGTDKILLPILENEEETISFLDDFQNSLSRFGNLLVGRLELRLYVWRGDPAFH